MSDAIDASRSGRGSDRAKEVGDQGQGPRTPSESENTSEATRIYLVRHGRTALNASGVLRGHLDPELDVVGLRQASVLGDVLGRHEMQRIVSSPLKRAVETAEGIACHTGLTVEIDTRLIDRDYGRWAGKPREELTTRYGTVSGAPGVEPAHEVLARAMEALKDTSRRVPGGTAVMVSHDAVNSLLLAALDEELGSSESVIQDTGCFNVLEYRDQIWSVLSVNNAPAGHDSPSPVGQHVRSAPKSETQPIPKETPHG